MDIQETITVDLPKGVKATDKWTPGTDTQGKFVLQYIPFESVTVSGTASRKQTDGTYKNEDWSYEQIALISDGRKAFSGGKVYGTNKNGQSVAIKTLAKLMPLAKDKSSASVTVSDSALL